MSYTLRGRLESRLTALLPVLLGACAAAAVLRHWWPVELVLLMGAIGVALDLQLWHRVLPYQPAWASLLLGAAELGAVLAVVRAFGLQAPLRPALALFAAGWLLAFLLGQAGFPWLRLDYAESGGELGRAGLLAAAGIGLALVGSGATWYARRPPVVHLAAGVHQGPLVIDRRVNVVGEPGAVVRGGIVVRHDDVHIRNVTVVGGENGITVSGVRGTVLDGVTVTGAKLDGIHVRLAGIVIRNCTVDMLGNPLGQGIDISYTMDLGRSMVEGCTVTGGMQGIAIHSSATEVMDNTVSRTTRLGIAMTEMSMGMVVGNEVRDALGVGIYCNDRSMCMIERNRVIGTRPDTASGDPSRRGFGVLASFQSEADLRGNELASNPVTFGAVTNSLIRASR